MKAKDLWKKMLGMLFETGHPWITFKDPSNIRSPQDHVGVIHNSNLCTEITLNTSKEETAVCNLGSVHFHTHITDDGKFDTEKVKETTRIGMRMLDNVVDLNFYPTVESKNSNMKHRPVGIGIAGFQDALYALDISFASEECMEFSDKSMELIAHTAILTSSELAKERGAYESFKGSKWDRDILPVDTIALLEEERGIPTGIDKSESLDWGPVRESIKKYGMRNSNCMAIAPTATTANISGAIPGNEPIYKNIYVKANISGDFIVVNTYLINDLKKLGMWDAKMLEALKYHDGNISGIDSVPLEIKEKYKETFEIDMRWIMKAAALRGKWIDQAQSLNIFYKGSSGKEISDLYQFAWEIGVKTTYYLRTLAASQVEKSTVGTADSHLRDKGGDKKTNTPAVGDSEIPAVSPPSGSPVEGAVLSPLATPSPLTKEKIEASKTKVVANSPKKFNLHVAEESICESCE